MRYFKYIIIIFFILFSTQVCWAVNVKTDIGKQLDQAGTVSGPYAQADEYTMA